MTEKERESISISGSHHFMNVFRKVEFQNNRVSEGGGYAEGGADG